MLSEAKHLGLFPIWERIGLKPIPEILLPRLRDRNKRVTSFVTGRANCGEDLKSMAELVYEVLLTEAPLDAPPRNHDTTGAVVDFWGVVQKFEMGTKSKESSCQAHQHMAEHQLSRLPNRQSTISASACQVVTEWIYCCGEPSLFLRASSLHREEALHTSQWIVTS